MYSLCPKYPDCARVISVPQKSCWAGSVSQNQVGLQVPGAGRNQDSKV